MQGSVVTWKYIHARDSERVLRGVWDANALDNPADGEDNSP